MPVTSYSTTAANNNSAAPNGAPEGMAPSSLNDTIRQIMADIALEAQINNVKVLKSIAGTNTITADMDPELGAYSAGMMVVFTPANTNTGATTINIDGLGALDIQKESGGALIAGDLVAGIPAALVLDSGADDFILLNPQATLSLYLTIASFNSTFNAKIISAVKTADETSNSSSAQSDDHLAVTLAAATWYAFEGYLYVDSAYNGSFNIGLTETAAHQIEEWTAAAFPVSGSSASYGGTVVGGDVAISVLSAANVGIMLRGFIKTHASTPPTVTLQWWTAGSNATVQAGSHIKFTKIP